MACPCHGAQASFYSLFAQGKAGRFPEQVQALGRYCPRLEPTRGQETEGISAHCKYGEGYKYIFSKVVKGLSSLLLKHCFTKPKILPEMEEQENELVWVQIFGVGKQMSCTCVYIKNTLSIFAVPEGTSTEED